MLFEGRVPNDEDYTNFAIGQGIRVGDELLELEEYASHFIELARNYSGNDIFTQVLLEQKVSQYCEGFLK
jgi:hypothetical protein